VKSSVCSFKCDIYLTDILCNCAGVHSEGNVGMQNEMYQLSLSPDELVIKQRGRRHSLQPLCLNFVDHNDSGA